MPQNFSPTLHDYLCQKLWWAKNGLFAWSLTKLWDLQLSNAIMSQSYFTSIPFWCTFKPPASNRGFLGFEFWRTAFLWVHYYQKKNIFFVNPLSTVKPSNHFLRLVGPAIIMLEKIVPKNTYLFADEEIEVGKPEKEM